MLTVCVQLFRENETPEERADRKEQERKQRKENETPEERAERKEKERKERKEKETPEERDKRKREENKRDLAETKRQRAGRRGR